jgi:hypothetical protein
VTAYYAQDDDDALRLLQAINTEQAHGHVGALVYAFAAARSAGLRPGTERYEEALWRLVWEGALTVAEQERLSEKGYEQRSDRVFGQYRGPKWAKKGRSRGL